MFLYAFFSGYIYKTSSDCVHNHVYTIYIKGRVTSLEFNTVLNNLTLKYLR